MQFERNLTEVGGSLMFPVPSDLVKFLGLKAGDVMVMQDENGKKGIYISVWKKG